MVTKQLWHACPLLGAVLLLAVAGRADTLSVDGAWHTQYQLMGASGETFATEYTATANEAVSLTGFWDNTDRYTVFVNGSWALTTGGVSGPAMDYGDKNMYTLPSMAWGTGLFSSGALLVSTNDVIKIEDIGPLFPSVNYPGSFDAQVGIQAQMAPEPASAFLLGLGALVAGVAFKKRRVA